MAPAKLDATQCKMARAALGIGVPELAARAVVSPDSVFRLERARGCISARLSQSARLSRRRESSLLTIMAAGRVYGLSQSKRW
jgi:hypothetical protein